MSIGSLRPSLAVSRKLAENGIRYIHPESERTLCPWGRFGPFSFGRTFPQALAQPLASALAVRVSPGFGLRVDWAWNRPVAETWLEQIQANATRTGLNPDDIGQAEIERHVRQLRGTWAYQELTVAQVIFRLPGFRPGYSRSLTCVKRWEHYAFAYGFFGHLVRYLEIDECLQPEDAWRQLHHFFRLYVSARTKRSWKHLDRDSQRRHLVSLRLAMYERLVALMADVRAADPAMVIALGARPDHVRRVSLNPRDAAPEPRNAWEALDYLLQTFLLYTKLTLRGYLNA